MHGELPVAPVGSPPTAVAPQRPYRPGTAAPPYGGSYPQEPPPAAQDPKPRRSPALRYALYGLVLVAVAVLSGLIWWAVHPSSGSSAADSQGGATTSSQPAGRYQFAKAHGTVTDSNCAAHAYGKTKAFFAGTPCRKLSRTVYVTHVDGVRVFSGVRVITMRSAADAAELEHLTDTNGTGNVTDLLQDGIRVTGAPKTVKGGAYASGRHGAVVTIVESKPETGKPLPKQKLNSVSRDALRLGSK